MYPELTKKEKQLARELVAKGLQAEIKKGMLTFYDTLQRWRDESETIANQRDQYDDFCGEVKEFQKMLRWKYDNRMADTADVILLQLRDGLYPESELDIFRPESKEAILQLFDRRWGQDKPVTDLRSFKNFVSQYLVDSVTNPPLTHI
jgi:hypothetical protein